MPETKETTAKKTKMSPLVGVGIGCFILLILVGTAISFAMKFFAKKVGTSMLQGVIENKTGVKTNLDDIEKGKMTFTDNKTGQKVTVGSQQVPENFPKDFPVYKDAVVAGSVAGTQGSDGNGFLVTFTTKDAFDKVVKFYTDALTAGGWKTIGSFNTDKMQTFAVSKDTLEGSLSITSEQDTTTILVTLGEKK